MLIEDAQRLEKIDRLYSLRLDQLISLPILAVVGDQSSGKSSVLEALTGLPFPRDSTLCTRFPTQIVFKRSPERHVNVDIIPYATVDERQAAELRDFASSTSRPNAGLQSHELLAILDKASHMMGLAATDGEDSTTFKSFSRDLLKIEISGPDHDHFSVIDLPGLFRKPTPGQSSKEDMLLVRDMITTHLQNERSIILAVVPANVDIATQEIIQMAEDADPGRKRTLAVLTKPDLVDKGAEEQMIKLVNGTTSESGLGYVVVCNRSQRDLHIPLADRHRNERRFFACAPWSAISSDRAGVSSLKIRLSTLTVDASRQAFEQVRMEVIRKLTVTKTQLEAMGIPRDTVDAQRIFLLQIVSEFSTLVNKATDAHYGRDECFLENVNLRLATVVMEENQKFSRLLARNGAYRSFTPNAATMLDSDHEQESGPTMDEVSVTPSSTTTTPSKLRSEAAARFSELAQLLDIGQSIPSKSNEPLREWIACKHREFRGFEVSGSNTSLITALVFEQTSSWQYYATQHVANVIRCIHRCIHDLLQHVCHDESVYSRIWEYLKPMLVAQYEAALRHAKLLVDVERHGYPITLNHYFAQNIINDRKQRIEQRLKKMTTWHTSDENRQPLLRLDDILSSYSSNEDQTVEELEVVLKSYHKVARKRFVDNICKQVIDHMLICSKQGPLHAFSAESIGSLSANELQRLAGEDAGVPERRKRLRTEVDVLSQGRAVLQ